MVNGMNNVIYFYFFLVVITLFFMLLSCHLRFSLLTHVTKSKKKTKKTF